MGLMQWVLYKLIPWYTGLGITKRTVTLEVCGRKTGRPLRTSLSRTEYNGHFYFVSLAGESSWVRNVRAARGEASILSGGKKPVHLIETKPEERGPVLLAYVQERAFTHSGPESSHLFFGLGPHPTLEEMQNIADRYIVFEIVPEEAVSPAAA